MDAPPEQEDCLPFMCIAGYLEAMRLNAPRIVEASPEDGFLLLTDLGSTQYFDTLLEDPTAAPSMYADALEALRLLQVRGIAYQSSLPSYDEELLRFELSLFHDCLCETHLGLKFTAEEEVSWQGLCDLLVRNALDQPLVFVHRDFHSRNLMLTDLNNPGILDFQDAVEGPLTYDLVSLLKDCYLCWPQQQVREWALGFYADLDALMRQRVDAGLFMRYFLFRCELETHLGLKFTAEEEVSWQGLCDLLVRNALDQPLVFVHRDFHSRNLMLTDLNNPGILDFQDAVEGPLTYDLVSLLKDCYLCWPQQQVREWALGFYADLDALMRQRVDAGLFMRYFDLMGVQRHLKASGIFARLKHRDGKPAYMADVPRTLGYIVELAPQYDELGYLVELIKIRCLPALENLS